MQTSNLKDYAVVILGYKSLGNLYNRIDELKKQTHPPKEIILLINQYPNEVSSALEFFAKNESSITFWGRFSQNIGIVYAWNLGMKITQTEVCVVLNDDCEIGEHTMEDLVKPFSINPKTGVTGVIWGNNPSDAAQTPQGFLIAYRKEALEQCGYYDEKASPLACERELSLRLISHGWKSYIVNAYWKHVHDISNHPETVINYLGKEWIPLRDQLTPETHLSQEIDRHNRKIRNNTENEEYRRS
jgi:GT2 family glycosyltransferase